MDFWTDIAFAVLFRTIKNPKLRSQFYSALAKLYLTLDALLATDPKFNDAVVEKGGGTQVP